MLNCKDASRLLSQALDRDLSLKEKLALRLHIAICTACERVEKQLKFLHRAIARLPGGDAGS